MRHSVWTASAIALVAVLLSGCANPVRLLREQRHIPFLAFPSDEEPAMYLWPPYTSAAIVDSEGNRCILTASGAQSLQSSQEFALAVQNAFAKVGQLDASAQQALAQSFSQISKPDQRSTALDIALFHLCILDQNGTFKTRHMRPGRKGVAVLQAYQYTVQTIMGSTVSPPVITPTALDASDAIEDAPRPKKLKESKPATPAAAAAPIVPVVPVAPTVPTAPAAASAPQN